MVHGYGARDGDAHGGRLIAGEPWGSNSVRIKMETLLGS